MLSQTTTTCGDVTRFRGNCNSNWMIATTSAKFACLRL
jgi:hypothetical protein